MSNYGSPVARSIRYHISCRGRNFPRKKIETTDFTDYTEMS